MPAKSPLRKSRQAFPRRLCRCVAFAYRSSASSVFEHSRAASPLDAQTSASAVRCQYVGANGTRGHHPATDRPHSPNTGCPGARSNGGRALARPIVPGAVALSHPLAGPLKRRGECHENCDNHCDREKYEGGPVAIPLVAHEVLSLPKAKKVRGTGGPAHTG
jgi:hypothetical protein